ncbi:MAG: ATP-dependent DNA helicase RecQ [Thermonemataceae bacterium]|nr:ATP-dependent DNA helicase RecQ [Thermonemataceae bacterium]
MQTELSEKAHQVLKQYWGYQHFRPLQEEIVVSVLSGIDTLALLPTGGGKSICFQVPAMCMEGLCIVVSPLIALMRDQVDNLRKKNINAYAIFSGMSRREIDHILDHCVYGKAKFLYVSPERLQTDLFKERLKKMKVALLAIDEAHCISQWGYDFRPPYLEITELRKLIPEVPCIALTATATEVVKGDIQEKLSFKPKREVFQKSFSRKNLSYSCFYEENKTQKVLQVLKNVQGSSVLYANTRKKVQEIAQILQQNKINADFYHAGLSNEERSRKQEAWIKNKTRVIVATNAFGMGIDKPDVRTVIHWDLPASLEAYYQEAGRAGRDEQKAYAVALYDKNDIEQLQISILKAYPSLTAIKNTYQMLANYYQLAIGAGNLASFDFDFNHFVKTFNLEVTEAHFSLKILNDEGLIQLSEAYYSPSKILFLLNKNDLYAFQVANKNLEPLIQLLLRMYGGEVINYFTKISESAIAREAKTDSANIIKGLEILENLRVLIYEKQKDKPQLTFLSPRQNADTLAIDMEKINSRKERDLRKAKSVGHYVQHKNRCRTQLLLEYFGEISYEPCGVCDVCLQKKKEHRLSENYYELYRERIFKALEYKSLTIEELLAIIQPQTREALIEALQKIIEVGELEFTEENKLRKNN